MSTKKINIQKFSKQTISKEDSLEIKGGFKLSIGGVGSTGFINWDELEIREEGDKIIFGFRPQTNTTTSFDKFSKHGL